MTLHPSRSFLAAALLLAAASAECASGLVYDLTAVDTATAKVLKTIPVGQVPNAVLVDD